MGLRLRCSSGAGQEQVRLDVAVVAFEQVTVDYLCRVERGEGGG